MCWKELAAVEGAHAGGEQAVVVLEILESSELTLSQTGVGSRGRASVGEATGWPCRLRGVGVTSGTGRAVKCPRAGQQRHRGSEPETAGHASGWVAASFVLAAGLESVGSTSSMRQLP